MTLLMTHSKRLIAIASVLLATVCWTRWDARATDFAAPVSPKEAAQIDRLVQGVVDRAQYLGFLSASCATGRLPTPKAMAC
jgi:hypothetical protein